MAKPSSSTASAPSPSRHEVPSDAPLRLVHYTDDEKDIEQITHALTEALIRYTIHKQSHSSLVQYRVYVESCNYEAAYQTTLRSIGAAELKFSYKGLAICFSFMLFGIALVALIGDDNNVGPLVGAFGSFISIYLFLTKLGICESCKTLLRFDKKRCKKCGTRLFSRFGENDLD